jgi:hypothetical protein
VTSGSKKTPETTNIQRIRKRRGLTSGKEKEEKKILKEGKTLNQNHLPNENQHKK